MMVVDVEYSTAVVKSFKKCCEHSRVVSGQCQAKAHSKSRRHGVFSTRFHNSRTTNKQNRIFNAVLIRSMFQGEHNTMKARTI